MSNILPFPSASSGTSCLASHVNLLEEPLTSMAAAERASRGARLGTCWLTTREPDTVLLNSVARAQTGNTSPIQWHVVTRPDGRRGFLGLRVC